MCLHYVSLKNDKLEKILNQRYIISSKHEKAFERKDMLQLLYFNDNGIIPNEIGFERAGFSSNEIITIINSLKREVPIVSLSSYKHERNEIFKMSKDFNNKDIGVLKKILLDYNYVEIGGLIIHTPVYFSIFLNPEICCEVMKALGFEYLEGGYDTFSDLFWYINLQYHKKDFEFDYETNKFLSLLTTSELLTLIPNYDGPANKASIINAYIFATCNYFPSNAEKYFDVSVEKVYYTVSAYYDYHDFNDPYFTVASIYQAFTSLNEKDISVVIDKNYTNIDTVLKKHKINFVKEFKLPEKIENVEKVVFLNNNLIDIKNDFPEISSKFDLEYMKTSGELDNFTTLQLVHKFEPQQIWKNREHLIDIILNECENKHWSYSRKGCGKKALIAYGTNIDYQCIDSIEDVMNLFPEELPDKDNFDKIIKNQENHLFYRYDSKEDLLVLNDLYQNIEQSALFFFMIFIYSMYMLGWGGVGSGLVGNNSALWPSYKFGKTILTPKTYINLKILRELLIKNVLKPVKPLYEQLNIVKYSFKKDKVRQTNESFQSVLYRALKFESDDTIPKKLLKSSYYYIKIFENITTEKAFSEALQEAVILISKAELEYLKNKISTMSLKDLESVFYLNKLLILEKGNFKVSEFSPNEYPGLKQDFDPNLESLGSVGTAPLDEFNFDEQDYHYDPVEYDEEDPDVTVNINFDDDNEYEGYMD